MGSITHITDRPRAVAAVVAVGTLAFTACAGGDDADTAANDVADQAAELSAESAADASFDATADEGFAVGGAPAAEDDAPADNVIDIGVVGRDVIVEMRVVVSSDDIQRTVASVTAAASSFGGGVASSDVNFGSADADGFAVLVVKVPPDSVDRLLSGLDDTGSVQSINQSAQDVTEQLVDLDVRIANARTSVDNVREFMARTENLTELVSLEAELTRRQTDLEQLEARKRNLADRVALSTITIEVVPTAAVPEPADEDETIGDAFRSGWDALTAFAFGIGFVIAATLPFLTAGLLLAVAAWLVIRRRDRRPIVSRSTTPPAEPPAPGDDGRDDQSRDDQPRDDQPDRRPEPAR